MKDEPRNSGGGGLSPKTLLIAGATSAITAFVVPQFWEPGTVFAAAMTPIIAAVVTELLRRPVDTVEAVTVKKKKVAGGAVVFEPPQRPAQDDFDPLAPASAEELEALPPTTSSRALHRRRGLTPRQWKLALGTGLLAFACVAVLLTVSELVAGDPVASDRGRTTFFGGSAPERDDAKPADEPREGKAERDAEETTTPTPTATPTPTPTATATPAPTETPAPAPGAAAEPTPAPSASPTPAP